MRNVVITGMGITSSVGLDVDTFSDELRAGTVAIRPSPWTPDRDDPDFGYWSVITGFRSSDWLPEKVAAGSDLFTQHAFAAATQAVKHAGIDFDPRRTAVVHGTSTGGARSLMKAQHEVALGGPEATDRKLAIKYMPNMAAAQLALNWGLHGPQLTVCSACASSLDALGLAAQMVASGRVDVALVGATEGPLAGVDGEREGSFVPVQFYGQHRFGMHTQVPDASEASLPFDVRRTGIVTGEGSAMFVIESREHAEQRGATILASIMGTASLADAYHPSSPEPNGRWEAEAMRMAQADAGVRPADVTALVAHATATPKGDFAEIAAINSVFGPDAPGLPVMSLKGHIGHSGAASGGMGVIVGIKAQQDGVFPHTAGTREVEPSIEFEVVTEAPIKGDFGVFQVNAFGFGGQDASIVVGPPEANGT